MEADHQGGSPRPEQAVAGRTARVSAAPYPVMLTSRCRPGGPSLRRFRRVLMSWWTPPDQIQTEPRRDVRVHASGSYAGRVTDGPRDGDTDAADGTGASADASSDAAAHEGDVVDTNVDRFIDRMVHGAGGAVAGNALVGMAKGMGLYKEPEIAAEIREVGPPEPDEKDPIEVT